jgi:hypothetical protein
VESATAGRESGGGKHRFRHVSQFRGDLAFIKGTGGWICSPLHLMTPLRCCPAPTVMSGADGVSMLSETPRPSAGPPSRVNQVGDKILPNDLWTSLEQKLARDVSARFSELARIPDSHAEGYTEGMSLSLREWMGDAMWVRHASESGLHDLLPDVKHKAMALGRQLEDVRRLFWEAEERAAAAAQLYQPYTADPRANGDYGYDAYMCGHFDVSVTDCALEALAALIGKLDRVTSRRRGRSYGTKAYPGLSQLVSQLEFSARCCGGGFTFDKRLGKGTLIEALNWLRAHCLSELDWTWMAPYLPTPNRHPLAVYESAMRAGRIDARFEIARMAQIAAGNFDGRKGTARLTLQLRPTSLRVLLAEIDGELPQDSGERETHLG